VFKLVYQREMLLFSDLHLSPSTLPTCMKVLRFVHAEALRRNTTVAFLGDFFDRVYNEGTLPVDILNGLMRFFSDEWRVPMVMIPGNHDYFDASETEHGLSPFQYASKYIRVVDEPTMIGRQLWVPWRRDVEYLKRTIEAHRHCEVIFGHFDIIGFKLNAKRVSSEGLSPSMFPDNVPVYTGHYHTPQVHGNIRYLGSPYQLTLSEAEDKKSLLVLDDHCHVSELIPIDVGRKQYKWTSAELLARSDILRSSDRVSVTCSLTDGSITHVLAELRDRGVTIQIRRLVTETATRVEKQKDMTPLQLLCAYADRTGIDTKSRAWERIVEWVSDNPSEQKSLVANPVVPMKMEISGLGPFSGPVTLSLQGDGFTLVSGQCNDSRGASNGAGKSIVTAGAWLWACTGHIDGRGTMAFDSEASVIHKGSESAQVNVSGVLDDAPWKIMRSLSISGRQRKHHLRFFLNHTERTRSTLAGTQRAIATELFGLDVSGSGLHQWLLRNSVWSQQSVSRWLDANDSQAKQEIHALANMEIWNLLWTTCKSTAKKSKEELVLAEQAQTNSKQNLAGATDRFEKNLVRAQEWRDSHERHLEHLREELQTLRKTLEETALTGDINLDSERERQMDEIDVQVGDTRNCIAKMTAHCERLEKELSEDWIKKDVAIEETELRLITPPDVEQADIRKCQCLAEKKARRIQLENKQKELSTFQAKGECSACGRPFDKGMGHHAHLRSLQERVEACRLRYRNANTAHVDSQQQFIHSKKKYDEYHRRLKNIQKVKSFNKIKSTLEEANKTFSALSERQIVMKRNIETVKRQKLLFEQTKRLREELERTIRTMDLQIVGLESRACPYDVSAAEKIFAGTEFAAARLKADVLRTQVEEAHAMLKWSGPRGIQTYAMEHAVQKLAGVMTEWLCRFFHTNDIRMNVFFDEKERLKRQIDCPKHAGVMSGGQWRRAQLASFMAWREVSGTTMPLLILDEACTSMDSDGIRSVQQTLRDWCEEDESRTCFFISHEPEQHRDTSVYQRHITIVHKRGRSSVVDESQSKKQKK